MSESSLPDSPASQSLLSEVQTKLETLIHRHQHLQLQFKELSRREQSLLGERARLIEKNEIARARIETMIPRLKQLEAAVE